jgi:hypothetical protein
MSKWRDSVTVPCVYTVTAYPPWPLIRQNQRSDHPVSLDDARLDAAVVVAGGPGLGGRNGD